MFPTLLRPDQTRRVLRKLLHDGYPNNIPRTRLTQAPTLSLRAISGPAHADVTSQKGYLNPHHARHSMEILTRRVTTAIEPSTNSDLPIGVPDARGSA